MCSDSHFLKKYFSMFFLPPLFTISIYTFSQPLFFCKTSIPVKKKVAYFNLSIVIFNILLNNKHLSYADWNC